MFRLVVYASSGAHVLGCVEHLDDRLAVAVRERGVRDAAIVIAEHDGGRVYRASATGYHPDPDWPSVDSHRRAA